MSTTQKQKHPLYATWYWMNTQQDRHKVDNHWKEFSNFVNDLGDKPSEKHRLHKIDSNLGYIRGNVIWREMLKYAPDFKSHSTNWQKRNPDKMKEYKLKSRFNLTEDEYQSKLESQQYKCEICNIPVKEYHQRLSVDHCHTTGKIRGLLCSDCNFMLGFSRDNITSLENAIKYLKKYS